MAIESSFGAPWSQSLWIMTGLSVGICLGIVLLGIVVESRPGGRLAMVGLPLVLLFITALLTIRSYTLTGSSLMIERLGWRTTIDLSQLTQIKQDPQAMDGSLRVWGNGGLFSFTGYFRNSKLGSYEAFATDPERSVVLKMVDRTIVVTPKDPQAFVEAMQSQDQSG